MGRTENIAIFEDTTALCHTEKRLKKAIQQSSQGQKLILEGDSLPTSQGVAKYQKPAKLIVSKKRTFEAASAYVGKKVCVLNFASASNPGGGVVRGATAQEECLCRCSTLYFNLNERRMWNGFYTPHRRSGDPLHNDDCIYTPDTVVFKSDTDIPQILPEEEWYSVNVITCAAPNLRERPTNAMNPGDGRQSVSISQERLRNIHEKKLRRILDIAVDEGNEVMILGAFGCGAFRNDPAVVASAMYHVVQEYRRAFETIEFAVYCSPRDDRNYQIFQRCVRG